ncbi:MAG: hypothetical protein LBQ33_00710 [Oscillospiraceae bacterium]|nr:hypothetical protein [Oscillospiraceae bacterium]
MRKVKRKLFCLLLMVFLPLCACGQGASQEADVSIPLDISLEKSQIFLVEPFMDRLGIYDLTEMQWEPIVEQDAFFQSFGWGNVYPYIVFGQHFRLFHAGRIAGSVLEFNYTLEDKQQSLGPFATNGDLFLYIIEQITKDDYTKRVVTISETGELELVANLGGMGVMGGTIAGDHLYFPCPVDDTDFYEVWRFDLTKNDPYQSPELIRDDYTAYRLYQYKGNIVYLDDKNETLYNDESTIPLGRRVDEIMIDEEVNVLVMQYVTQESGMETIFTDISSGQILGTYPNAINFTREGSVITIYGNGFIEELNLSQGD